MLLQEICSSKVRPEQVCPAAADCSFLCANCNNAQQAQKTLAIIGEQIGFSSGSLRNF